MSSVEERTTALCLVRHGETPWNREHRLQGRQDIPLNEAGREQALQLAKALATNPWDLLASSPLLRAWETATIIATQLGLPQPLAVPELVERDYGAASGMTKAEAAERFPLGAYPGSETRADVQTRCLPLLDHLADKAPGGSVLVVTHGSVIKSLLLAISGGAIPDLRNASASLLQRSSDGRWQIEYYDRSASDLLGSERLV
jgi:probable phosphoglycerate mutase